MQSNLEAQAQWLALSSKGAGEEPISKPADIVVTIGMVTGKHPHSRLDSAHCTGEVSPGSIPILWQPHPQTLQPH